MVDRKDKCLSNVKNYVEFKAIIFNILTGYVNLLILFIFFVSMLFVTCKLW